MSVRPIIGHTRLIMHVHPFVIGTIAAFLKGSPRRPGVRERAFLRHVWLHTAPVP
jgi:hypothetical protein